MIQTFTALLRGINVGGKHKVPMKELKTMLENLGFSRVKTLLNSGNVVFDSTDTNSKKIEIYLETELEKQFGFPIPTIVCAKEELKTLIEAQPFNNIELTSNLRFYITFLKEKPTKLVTFSFISDDKSFQIISGFDSIIASVVDVSIGDSIKAMAILEKRFGKQITTRNWNTIVKIWGLMGDV